MQKEGKYNFIFFFMNVWDFESFVFNAVVTLSQDYKGFFRKRIFEILNSD